MRSQHSFQTSALRSSARAQSASTTAANWRISDATCISSLRSDYETVRKKGLRLRSKNENIHVRKGERYRSTEEIGPCDLVIVAVKTTSNPELPPLIAPLLGEKTMILTLQNGLGNEEFLADRFGAERILGGLCYICLNRTAPGVVERFDAGRLTIGEYLAIPNRAPMTLHGNSSAAGSCAAWRGSRARALAQTGLEHSV